MIGLGNPGPEYRNTRHNVGWLFLDFVAEEEGVSFRPGKGRFFVAETPHFRLIKPTTYMNLSGQVVPDLERVYGPFRPEELLVVLDDAHLPFGTLRLRMKGSSGGHKGLESMIYYLGTEIFPRLRIGVGRPPGRMSLRDWVLSPFTEKEWEVLPVIFAHAYRGVRIFVEEGPQQAMNFINGRRFEE